MKQNPSEMHTLSVNGLSSVGEKGINLTKGSIFTRNKRTSSTVEFMVMRLAAGR